MGNFQLDFIDGDNANPSELRYQLISEIQAALPHTVTSRLITRGEAEEADEADAVSVSMFSDVAANALLTFDLSDRNYFLLNWPDNIPRVSTFDKVFVAGEWLKTALLDNTRLGMTEDRIVVAGSPRIDLLRRLAQEHDQRADGRDVAQDAGSPRVLYAPMPNNWFSADGDPMSTMEVFAESLALLKERFDITALQDGRNRPGKEPITDELLRADVVITDYSSVMYEAWALGKPVIFPRWLTGDNVLDKAPRSAEAHVYRERIGHHASSLIELNKMLEKWRDLGLGQGVEAFMTQYLANYRGAPAGETIARHLAEMAIDHRQRMDARMLRTAKELISKRKYNDADPILTDLISSDPENPTLYDYMAVVRRGQLKSWQEIETLQKLIDCSPTEQDSHYFRLGEAQERMKQYRGASKSFEKAVALCLESAQPTRAAEWYYRLGFVLGKDGFDGPGNPEKQAQAYARACELDKKLDASRFGVGVYHQKRGFWSEARDAYYQTLNRKMDDADLIYKLAMANDRCYFWSEAEELYALAIHKKKPSQPAWYFRLGFVLERQGKYHEAVDAYTRGQVETKTQHRYWHYRSGICSYRAGDFEQACQAFIQMQTDNALANGVVTVASKFEMQRQAKAMAAARRLANVDPSNAEAWEKVGDTALTTVEFFHEAAQYYEKAANRSSDQNSALAYKHGLALWYNGQFEEACRAFIDFRKVRAPHGLSEARYDADAGLAQTMTYTEYRRALPLEKNTVLLESYHGASVSCNPYALYKRMVKDPAFQDWTFTWVINDTSVVPDWVKKSPGTYFVRRDSDAYLKRLAVSEYLVNNNTFPPYFSRRSEQKYLNTWHGTPIKTLGSDILPPRFEYRNAARNLLHATHVVMPNVHTRDILTKNHGIEQIKSFHEIVSGYPRIDATLDPETRASVRKKLGVHDENEVVVLYAPTYRGSSFSNSEKSGDELDFIESYCRAMELLHPDMKLLFRGHHLQEASLESQLGNLDTVSKTIDTNELLAAVDVLVTDYSSVAVDFMATGRPIVFFVPDLEEYTSERGIYFELDALSRFVAHDVQTAAALTHEAAHAEDYKLSEMGRDLVRNEDGAATQAVMDAFFSKTATEVLEPRKTHNILVYAGAFIPNGVTNSFLSLAQNLMNYDVSITVAVDPNSLIDFEDRMEQLGKLPPNCAVLPRVGHHVQTLEDKWVMEEYARVEEFASDEKERLFKACLTEEFQRNFGGSKFDTVINFEGYVGFWNNIFSQATSDHAEVTKVVYLHNDMWEEYKARFRHLRRNFDLYRDYDKLISVSKSTADVNRSALGERFNLSGGKFDFVDNCIVVDRIEEFGHVELEPEDAAFFEGKRVFINAARLSVEKGQDRLIEAFSSVAQEHPDAVLAILGEGPLRNTLEHQIRTLGLDENVRLFGRQENPFKFMSKADCFVFSSFYEGQGLVALEAMVLGIPVISTDFPCIHDVLSGGELGSIVPNNTAGLREAMLNFLETPGPIASFDGRAYQQNAIRSFLEKVCDMTPGSTENV